jgi:hypothetical protein
LLQFLQYRQQLEEEESTKRFEAMVGGISTGSQNAYSDEPLDERAIEESLKVWYGLDNQSSSAAHFVSMFLIVSAQIVIMQAIFN